MEKKECGASSEACKPDINYPCAWQFKIIGYNRDDITKVVETVVTESLYLLTDSNTSSKGRYISMGLELIVHSEEERLLLYQQLVSHQAIKIVL